MEIIEELQESQRNALLSSFQGHHHYKDIEAALGKSHCFRVHVYGDDFSNILINSSPKHHALPLREFPTLKSVVEEIQADNSFLNITRNEYGQLSGTRIKQFYDEYKQSGTKLECFFLWDRNEEMNKEAAYYVREGMHHLVAYGLAAEMRNECFPITGYYCTDKRPVSDC